MKRILLALTLLMIASQAFCFSAGEAEAAYDRKDYDKAISEYTALIKAEGESAPLLYNLGNCYWQTGNRSAAVLSYERALRIDPGNDEIRNNLDYILSKIADTNRGEAKGKNVSTVPDSPSFFESLHNYISREHSSNLWSGLAAGCFLLFIVCCAMYVFVANVFVRKIGFFAGIVLAVCVICFIPFAYMAASNQERKDQAVIIGYKTELLSDPDSESKPSSLPLTSGTVVDILSDDTNDKGDAEWYKVRLNSDYVGWIKADLLEII